MLRLVRDDDTMLMEEQAELQLQDDLQHQLRPDEAPDRMPPDLSEPQDGAVEDAEPSEPDAPTLDLPVLESLLFSTHHPLTAARLAEILDLDSTKPIRHAIKSLNDQYASTGRAFRVEQVAGGYQLLTLP